MYSILVLLQLFLNNFENNQCFPGIKICLGIIGNCSIASNWTELPTLNPMWKKMVLSKSPQPDSCTKSITTDNQAAIKQSVMTNVHAHTCTCTYIYTQGSLNGEYKT